EAQAELEKARKETEALRAQQVEQERVRKEAEQARAAEQRFAREQEASRLEQERAARAAEASRLQQQKPSNGQMSAREQYELEVRARIEAEERAGEADCKARDAGGEAAPAGSGQQAAPLYPTGGRRRTCKAVSSDGTERRIPCPRN
ncbi:MAG: hypothetical protein HQ461_04220, partial [Deltaproteobacteria bacterium]|nr:hypothetical protein [Deltaproteobacteria bacterium]